MVANDISVSKEYEGCMQISFQSDPPRWDARWDEKQELKSSHRSSDKKMGKLLHTRHERQVPRCRRVWQLMRAMRVTEGVDRRDKSD